MPSFQLTLHLISTETRQPLANLRVEAWDKDVRHNDLLGSVITDESGRCIIRFDERYYADSRDPLPDVFFRVYEGERLRHSTEHSPMQNLAAGEYSFMLEVPGQGAGEGSFVVRGQVLDAFKKPLPGLGVEAWDVDLWQDSPLGGTTTDTQGKYSIAYTRAQFARAEKDSADLKVLVKNAAGLTAATSEILYQAPAEAEINFTLEAKALGLSEYEQYQAILLLVLDGRNLAEVPDEKLEFLSRETGIPYQHIQYLRQDQRDGAPNQLPPTALYGLYRQGLSTNLRRLVAEKPERWGVALKTSLEQNLIPAGLATQTDYIQQRLREIALQYAFEMPDEGEEAPIGVVLSSSGLSDSKQREVAAVLQHHEPSPDQDEWESLRERAGLSEPELQAVRFTLETNRLAGGHQPTLRVLQNLRQDRGWTQTRDLARLNRAEWQQTVQDLPLPEGFTSHADYAEEMAFRMETVFPTAVYLHRLQEMGDPANGDTTAFLSSNPGFDLLHSAVDTYINNGAVLDPNLNLTQLRVNLKQDQRRARIAPTRNKFFVMEELKKQGIDSALSMAKRGKDSIINTFSDAIGEDVVANMYEESIIRSEVTLLMYNGIKDVTTGVAALPAATGAVTETPEWAALFGTLNSCECEHCRSVYSPAAYLVDILKFIKDAPGTAGALQRNLFDRRPELPHILLNCDNANVPLPYIDLVNEIFERYITGDTGAPWPQTVVEEPYDKEKLRAEPQHEREAAYNLLSRAYHPWVLPFNLNHEKAKAFAQHMGIPLYEAYEIARFPERNIVKAHLWISEEVYRLITIPADGEPTLARNWGVPDLADLQQISVLMAKSGLEYEEVDRLIQSALFKHLELEIDRSVSPCNYEQQSLIGLSDLYRQRFFDWIHRLLRLQRALGWTFTQFMDVLDALKLVELLDGESLGDYFDRFDRVLENIIPTFSKLIRISERLRMKVEKAAALEGSAKIAKALKVSEKELEFLSHLITDDEPPVASRISRLFILTQHMEFLKAAKVDLPELVYLLLHVDLTPAVFEPKGEDVERFYRALHQAIWSRPEGVSFPAAFTEEVEQELSALIASRLSGLVGAPNEVERNRLIGSASDEILQAIPRSGNFQDKIFGEYLLAAGTILHLLNTHLTNLVANIDALNVIRNTLSPPQPLTAEERNALIPGTAALIRQDIEKRLGAEAIIIEQLAQKLTISADIWKLLLTTDFDNETTGRYLIHLEGDVSTSAITVFQPLVNIQDYRGIRVDDRANMRYWFIRLDKIARLLSSLGFNAEEIQKMYALPNTGDTLAALDLTSLPIVPTVLTLPEHRAIFRARFEYWKWMVRLKLVQSKYPKADRGVLDFITQAQSYSGTFENFIRDEINAYIGWGLDELRDLCNDLSILEVLSFRQLDAYERIEVARTWLRRWGSTDGQIGLWATSYLQILSQTLKTTAENRFGEDKKAWYKALTPIMDNLRERKRDALVAYLLANNPPIVGGEPAKDTNDLYAHFLIDPEMSACMMSSRIVQAHNTVQLYVQRLLMGLEDIRIGDSEAETEYCKRWEWQKNYRVWEAARKVFLYPENWIESELRDNKSPFFEELENELLQDEVTQESVERAFRGYLTKLDEVARLDVRSLYEEEREGGQKILHVVARTFSEPHIYYYRKRMPDRVWTAWEKVDLGIEGEHVFPVVHNGRLMIFWAVFKEEGTYWNIKIYWSQWRDGAWEAAKSISKNNLPKVQFRKMEHKDEEFPISSFTFRTRQNHLGELQLYLFASIDYPNSNIILINPNHFNDDANPDNGIVRNTGVVSISPTGGLVSDLFGGPSPEGTRRPVRLTRTRLYSGFYSIGTFKFNSCMQRLQLSEDINESLLGLLPTYELPIKNMGFSHQPYGTEEFAFPALSSGISPQGVFFIGNENGIWIDGKLTLLEHFSSFGSIRTRLSANRWGNNVSILENFGQNLELTGNVNDVNFDAFSTFFIQNEERSYLVLNQSINYYPFFKFRFEANYYPFKCDLIKEFNEKGLDHILNASSSVPILYRQMYKEALPVKFHSYHPTTNVWRNTTDPYEVYPYEHFDFSHHGAYSLYNWELFFHISLLVADRLSKNQKFEEARRWFHYIFDPTDVSREEAPAKFWKIKPFFEEAQRWAGPAETLEEMMRRLATGAQDVENQVSAWRDDPFNPHLIARLRPVTYMKTTVIKYIENLIAWADSLFLRYTRESINEAIQLYILAAELLGKRPVRIPATERIDLDYSEVETHLDSFSNFLVNLENGQPVDLATARSSTRRGPMPPNWVFYFCIPDNDKLLGFWDTIADRLFKIRHCMNIEGVAQPLALFDPPIDPALLVRARAAGLDLATALSGILDIRAPHYRFSYMIQKAQEFCSEVRGFGGALLAALEKKDAEELNLLRSRHEIAMMKLIRFVKDQQLEEAEEALEGIQASLRLAETRLEFYTAKSAEFTNASEKQYLGNLNTARDHERIAEGFDLAASIAFAVPDFHVAGVASGTTYGGSHVGQLLNSTAQKIKAVAGQFSFDAQMASITAGYERRKEDWDLQADLAQKELDQIDKQILAAEIRVAIAELEISNHEKQTEHAEEVEFFQKNKFTNKQLYSWQAAQLASLHYQAYQMAFDLAKKAQKAAQMELGIPAADLDIIAFDNWDSLKKGLLVGDRLSQQLRRLESAYLSKNKREFELTKHISLQQLNPLALLYLRETGKCDFLIPEELFDLDFPGHYYRRIRSVSISLPCVAGPYTTINATLRLNQSRVRKETGGTDYAESTDVDDPRFDYYRTVVQSIATSSAQNDGGLFELNFRDERYLPFEYSGVISEWSLEMMEESSLRQFDYNTIADVIVHLRYTAREDGSLKPAAITHLTALTDALGGVPFQRLFSLRHDFPNEWHTWARQNQPLSIQLERHHFPYFAMMRDNLTMETLESYRKGSESQESPSLFVLNQDNWEITRPAPTTTEDLADDYFLIVHYTIQT